MLIYAIPANVIAMMEYGGDSNIGLYSVFGGTLISGSISQVGSIETTYIYNDQAYIDILNNSLLNSGWLF